MTDLQRRRFMKIAGGAAAAVALPTSLVRALSIKGNSATGSIRDIEHVVILMQENRGFDHYFGSLRGVRGFADRLPIPVPSAADATNRAQTARNACPWREMYEPGANPGANTI